MKESTTQPKSLGQIAAGGTLWITGQSILARVISISANFILAWLLNRQDFGLLGLAFTISGICEVFGSGGIARILMRRPNSFRLWATPAFWLSLTLGCMVSTLILSISLIAIVFGNVESPHYFFLMMVLIAVNSLIESTAVVYSAKLRSDLRFKSLAILETSNVTASTILKVILASVGWGALSFPAATLVSRIARILILRKIAPVAIGWHPNFPKWSFLVGPAIIVMFTDFFLRLITYGDYLILSAFSVSRKDLGLYYFAFSFSILVMTMLSQGLVTVLLPTYAKIVETDRRSRAFLRSCNMASLIVFPACFAQSIAVAPAIHLFGEKWVPAIPLLQILSVGMAPRAISWLTATLQEAEGKYRARLGAAIVSAALFLPIATCGYYVGNLTGMAIAVSIYYPLMAFGVALYAGRSSGIAFSKILGLFTRPLAVGLATVSPCVLLQFWDPSPLIQLSFIAVATLAAFPIAARLFMPVAFQELMTLFAGRFQRFAFLLPPTN